MKNIFLVVNDGLILILLAACGAFNPPTIQSAPTPTAEVPNPVGAQYYFVTDQLLIPTTQAQREAFALNVDGDSQNLSDNMFGDLLILLTSAASDLQLQSTLDQAVDAGQLASLHLVKTEDLSNASGVSWSIFPGQKTESVPRFDGSDEFTVDSTAPLLSPIIGSLTNGHFAGGPGATQVQLFLLDQSFEVGLIGVRLEADLTAQGCTNGKLGGGVTVEEFRGKVLPAIADGLNQIIQSDGAVTSSLLQFFDADRDGAITVQELENNPLLALAISPDMDLLDASGGFNPGQDGVKDSYSLGLGFTCVPAIYSVPEQ